MQWEFPVLKCTQKELQWVAHVMHRKKPKVEWEKIQLVPENWSFHTASADCSLSRRHVLENMNSRFRSGSSHLPDSEESGWSVLRFQPVDATHWLNRSAGVSKSNVSLGLSLSRLATAFSLFW